MRTGAGSEVGTKFASGMTLKIAFVVQEKKGNRLMELYVNGILSGAKQYAPTDSLLQDEPANIRITSESADVEVRNCAYTTVHWAMTRNLPTTWWTARRAMRWWFCSRRTR